MITNGTFLQQQRKYVVFPRAGYENNNAILRICFQLLTISIKNNNVIMC